MKLSIEIKPEDIKALARVHYADHTGAACCQQDVDRRNAIQSRILFQAAADGLDSLEVECALVADRVRFRKNVLTHRLPKSTRPGPGARA